MGIKPYFTVEPDAVPPRRAYKGDAGLDLALQESCVVNPGETKYIPSGVSFYMPAGQCVHVMTRSSTFTRGVLVIPTIIDASYTGEASVIVSNISHEPVKLKKGDMIAQAVLLKYGSFTNEESPSASRGSGKFGSSGATSQ